MTSRDTVDVAGALRLRGGSGPTQPERKLRAVGAPVKKSVKQAVAGPSTGVLGRGQVKVPVKTATTTSKKVKIAEVPIELENSSEDDEDMEEVAVELPEKRAGDTDEDDLMTDATTASAPKTPTRGQGSPTASTPAGVTDVEDAETEEDFDAEAAYGYDFHAEEVARKAVGDGSTGSGLVDSQGIVISLGVDAQGRTPEERRKAELLANRKKAPTARDRALRLQAHKLHVVALLANAAVRNRWATDELLRSRLLSLTPHELHAAFHIPPSRYPDPVHRSRMFQAALQELATWWANEFFEVTDTAVGVRTRSWDDVMDIVDDLPRLRDKRLPEIIVISDGEVEYISSSKPPTSATDAGSAKKRGKQKAKGEDKDDSDVERFLAKLGDGGERIRTVKSMMKKALQGAGGRDTSAQLFVSLCRALGLGARLVVSLQPLQWKSDKAPPVKISKKVTAPPPPVDPKKAMLEEALAKVSTSYGKKKRARNRGKVAEKTQSEEEEEDDMEEVEVPQPGEKTTPAKARVAQVARMGGVSATASDADGESDAAHVNPRLNPRTANMEERYKLRKARPGTTKGAVALAKKKRKDEDLSMQPPVYWAEVYCRPDQKWIPVDPVRGVIKRKRDFEPSTDNGPVRMTYVVAFEEDGYARDITVRYATNFGAKTVKLRAPSNKNGVDWWERVIGMVKRPYRLNRDDLEDAELETSQISEGMPMVLSGFKDHPIYVLERHLKREEVIQPKREVGRFRGEPVYRRANVVSCKTPENWMRIGRKIKPKEEALKWVKQRAVTIDKRRAAALAEEEGQEAIQQGLYAEYQTELYRPAPIRNGIIPKNAFGNVDLYVPTMLPAGAAHLPYKGIAKVARQLKISFAEACTGFEFKKQRAIPVITGVVVPIEEEEALMEAYRESAAAAEERALSKKEEAALKRWKKLVRSIEIKTRLEAQYGAKGQAGEKSAIPSASTSNPRKKIRPSGAAKTQPSPVAIKREEPIEEEQGQGDGRAVIAQDFAAPYIGRSQRADGTRSASAVGAAASGSGDVMVSRSTLQREERAGIAGSGGFILEEGADDVESIHRSPGAVGTPAGTDPVNAQTESRGSLPRIPSASTAPPRPSRGTNSDLGQPFSVTSQQVPAPTGRPQRTRRALVRLGPTKETDEAVRGERRRSTRAAASKGREALKVLAAEDDEEMMEDGDGPVREERVKRGR